MGNQITTEIKERKKSMKITLRKKKQKEEVKKDPSIEELPLSPGRNLSIIYEEPEDIAHQDSRKKKNSKRNVTSVRATIEREEVDNPVEPVEVSKSQTEKHTDSFDKIEIAGKELILDEMKEITIENIPEDKKEKESGEGELEGSQSDSGSVDSTVSESYDDYSTNDDEISEYCNIMKVVFGRDRINDRQEKDRSRGCSEFFPNFAFIVKHYWSNNYWLT